LIAANATRFGRPEVGAFPPQLKPNTVEYDEHDSLSVVRKILSILLFVGSGASARCLSFLAQSRPVEIILEIHKKVGGMKPNGNFWLSCDIK
jgi:hypothetical protein